MKTLPMGRPSLTGLSVKRLGFSEYQRRRHPNKARLWRVYGLSRKELGGARYMRLYRKLKTELAIILAVV
jgi:hypothetical protein